MGVKPWGYSSHAARRAHVRGKRPAFGAVPRNNPDLVKSMKSKRHGGQDFKRSGRSDRWYAHLWYARVDKRDERQFNRYMLTETDSKPFGARPPRRKFLGLF